MESAGLVDESLQNMADFGKFCVASAKNRPVSDTNQDEANRKKKGPLSHFVPSYRPSVGGRVQRGAIRGTPLSFAARP